MYMYTLYMYVHMYIVTLQRLLRHLVVPAERGGTTVQPFVLKMARAKALIGLFVPCAARAAQIPISLQAEDENLRVDAGGITVALQRLLRHLTARVPDKVPLSSRNPSTLPGPRDPRPETPRPPVSLRIQVYLVIYDSR